MNKKHEINPSQLRLALKTLEGGGVVAFPTETVYGLGARIDNVEGLKRIFSVKRRPFFDPLIVHVNSIAMAKSLSKSWNPICDRLAEKFWPGPLTLVTEKQPSVDEFISAGLGTVGLRWPKSDVAEALIAGSGVAIAAPSANRFGKTSPTTAAHVYSEFGDDVMIIGGSESSVGIESTVLAVHGNTLTLLRPGFATKADIETALSGFEFSWKDAEKLEGAQAAPGQIKHHYMPDVPLVWVDSGEISLDKIAGILNEKNAELPVEVEGVELKKPKQFHQGEEILLPEDPVLAARQLYASLRSASEKNLRKDNDKKSDFLVFRYHPYMTGELWGALLERLTKATSLKLP